MATEKHLQGVDHRNPPKPYPPGAFKAADHPAFDAARSAANHKPIHHLDPATPYGQEPKPKITPPAAGTAAPPTKTS